MPVRSPADASSSTNHIPELDDFERATLEKSKSRLKQQQKSADTIWTVKEGPPKPGENYKKSQTSSSSKTGNTKYQKNSKAKSEYSSKSKYGYDSYSGPQSLILPGRFASLISSNSSTTNTLNSTTSSGSTKGKKSFLENPIFETSLKNWTLPRVQLYCKDPACLFNQQKEWGSHHDQEHHRDYQQQDLSDLNPNPSSVTTETRSLAFITSNANDSCSSSIAPSVDRNYSFAYGYYGGRDTLKSLPSQINSYLLATEVESYFPQGEQMPGENMTILQKRSEAPKYKAREGVYVQSSLRKQGMYSLGFDGSKSGSGHASSVTSTLEEGPTTPNVPLADKPPSTFTKGAETLGIDIVVTPPNHNKSVQNTIILGAKSVDLSTSAEELAQAVQNVKKSTQTPKKPCANAKKEVPASNNNTVVTLECSSATNTKENEINPNNLRINAVGVNSMKSTGSTSSKADSALDSGCNSPNSFLLPVPNRFQSSSSSSASSTGSLAGSSTESYSPSESSGCGSNRKNNKITPGVNPATTAPMSESISIIQELKPGEKDPELEYKAYSKWSGGGLQGQQSLPGNSTIYHTNSSGANGGYLVPSYAQGLPIIPPSPYCPNCSGILPSAGIPSQNPLDTLSSDGSRLKEPPLQGFWKLNKFYPYPLQRDHSFHSVGGFTLNGQYNVKTPQKPSMRRFCSSHKISLVVSTFSLLVTLGLLITLLLMKKRGMMTTMMDS